MEMYCKHKNLMIMAQHGIVRVQFNFNKKLNRMVVCQCATDINKVIGEEVKVGDE